MPALGDTEVVRIVKPVNLEPVLSVMDRLPFVAVGSSSPDKYKCDVVLSAHFPREVHEFIAGLDLGGQLARSVVRRLNPRQDIPAHVDRWMPQESSWRRFQIPLVSHPDIIMRWPDDGVSLHLEPGFLYEVRFDRTHEVIHGADCPRIHLQIDQIAATV